MRRLSGLLVLVWLPFLLVFAFASPALTERVGDSHPHVAFHVVAAALLARAAFLVRAERAEGGSRVRRGALVTLSITLPLAVVGHLAELATAVARLAEDGWVSRPTPDVFERGAHAAAANVTVPAMMLSMLLTLVLLVVGARAGRERADRAEAVR